MYKDALVQEVQAKSANTGALVNAVGNVAMTIASFGAIGAGGAMAKAGLAKGGAQGLAQAKMGQSVQHMGAQLLGRQIGGFSGIVIASNISQAYQNKVYGMDMENLTDAVNTMKATENKMSNPDIPASWIRSTFSSAGAELRQRKARDKDIEGVKK